MKWDDDHHHYHVTALTFFFPLCSLFYRDNHTPRSLATQGTIITLLDEGPDYGQRSSGFESQDYVPENSDDSD